MAFDHNVRPRGLKRGGVTIDGGNAVQGPAGTVHNDYSVTSAPRRLEQLAAPPKQNDTRARPAPAHPVRMGFGSGFAIFVGKRWDFKWLDNVLRKAQIR